MSADAKLAHVQKLLGRMQELAGMLKKSISIT